MAGGLTGMLASADQQWLAGVGIEEGVMSLAGPGGTRDSARWRVYVSHTSELRDFPAGNSYVAAVERAISAAGHVIVDMADFPASDQPAAELCKEQVRSCEVYVGVLGTRYGSLVRNKPEISYTELEFDTAAEAGLDRLVFLLDTDASDLGIPLSALIDHELGACQDKFRRRVRESGLTTQSFTTPAALGRLVERSLRKLAETRRRIDRGIQHEQVPADPALVRVSKFVNPPPAMAPTWFEDRQIETGLLADCVTDPGIRLVMVTGRGGIGKTAMVCRFLKWLEAGRIPDMKGDLAEITVGGIVYLSSNGTHHVEYPTLIADLLRLLPAHTAQQLQRLYQDPRHKPHEMMLAVLEAFPAGEPVVVLLDNLESVMDAERETLIEQALHEALTAVLTAPAHAITVISTTRVAPTKLLGVEPSRQRQLPLEEGLGSPDAETVLRALDNDGRLGLRDAPNELLDGLRRHTRGFPRALEAVKAILDGDRTLTPRDLLDRTRQLPEDQIIRVLVGEAYALLDAPAQQVMQALAVYPAPVSAVAVDFLLQPFNPFTNVMPLLTRLVRRQLVRFQDRQYYLHPIDREYVQSQIQGSDSSDSPAVFTLSRLKTRAAKYYAQIRTPQASWRTLEDIRPQLIEFELRCDIGDYDTAATVLNDIDYDYLQVWGHYRTLVGLHRRIHKRIIAPGRTVSHLRNLGLCCASLGHYGLAVHLHTQALAIDRDIGDRQGESADLGNLGNCHYRLGDYQQAIDLHTQALAIDRDIGDRQGESADLGNLGNCHDSLGDYWQAIDLHTQALVIDCEIGDRQGEAASLGNLGNCHTNLGDYSRAIDLHTQALTIAREIGDRQGEAASLGNLGYCHTNLGDYSRAIDLHTQALTIAREIGDRQLEGHEAENLGNCHYQLGDYPKAIDLHTQALTLAREIGNRYGEAAALASLGQVWLASGNERRAVTLLGQAVNVADITGDIESAVRARSGLAWAHIQLGDPATALAATAPGREIPYPTEEPNVRLLEGLALLELHRPGESVRAFDDTLRAVEALLALAENNVAALQARTSALSGLAVATADPVRADEAVQALTQLRTVTSAAGVVAETRRLFSRIALQDESGILAELRTAQDL